MEHTLPQPRSAPGTTSSEYDSGSETEHTSLEEGERNDDGEASVQPAAAPGQPVLEVGYGSGVQALAAAAAAAAEAAPAPAVATHADAPFEVGNGVISALAAVMRQQQAIPAAVSALAPATALPLLTGAQGAHIPPLMPSTADTLQLLIDCFTGANRPHAGSTALTGARATSTPVTSLQQQQQQQQQQQKLAHGMALPATTAVQPAQAGLAALPVLMPFLSASASGAMGAATALDSFKPRALGVVARPAATAAAMAASVMKRKASNSLPASPGMADACNLLNSAIMLASHGVQEQTLPVPQGAFSGNPQSAAGFGRGISATASMMGPQAWLDAAMTAAAAGAFMCPGFPTQATSEPDETDHHGAADPKDLALNIAAALAAASAAAPGAGNAADAHEHAGEQGMDVDISPTMAAAAAAMAGLAGLKCNSSGGGSAAVPLAAAAAAAGAAAGTGFHVGGPGMQLRDAGKPPVRSRKAMRTDGDGFAAMGGNMGTWQHLPLSQQAGPHMQLAASHPSRPTTGRMNRTAADAAAGHHGAGLHTPAAFAGSLDWIQQSGAWVQAAAAAAGMQGCMPTTKAAAAAAATAGHDDMNKMFISSDNGWSEQAHPQSDCWQQHSGRSRSLGSVGKAGSPQPRGPRGSKAKQDIHGGLEAAALRGTGGGTDGHAGATTVAGKRGPRGGGGKSSTSNFRGVTLHRYTQRWEAHLWDPDAARSKTAGSSRTRGKQTYLGGYSTEMEAARAYDRAALVYWGLKGFTNYPKEDYAAEMPLLVLLTREEVVKNLRTNSHAMAKGYQATYAGVVPHQALPGMFEARLSDGHDSYKYMGAYPSEEAAAQVLIEALTERRRMFEEAQAAATADAQLSAAAAAAAIPVGELPPVSGAGPAAAKPALPLLMQAQAKQPVRSDGNKAGGADSPERQADKHAGSVQAV